MAGFVHHEECPSCGSKDNLARYDDGSGWCFGCEHFEAPTDGERSTPEDKPKKADGSPLVTDGKYRALPTRQITQETCQFWKYKVGVAFHSATGQREQCHIAPYYDEDGKLQAQHLRFADKDMPWRGNAKDVRLFGQQLWRTGGKRLIITEGEIDAMSISQLQDNKWPVVSLPSGAQSAESAIARQIEWVESFETVVLAFDMDEPGQDAAKAVGEILTPGKVVIARLPMKDANECLVKGARKALMNSLWEARPYRPDGIVSVSDVRDQITATPQAGRPWPWKALTEATHGRRYGELYAFGGGTGCGKSTVFKQVMAHIITQEKAPVGGIFLEEPPKVTYRHTAGMLMGKRTHVPGVEFDHAVFEKTLDSLEGRLYCYQHKGGAAWDIIRAKIRYMNRALGVRDVFLDHITAISAAIEETDERKALDKIMANIGSLCQELDITIYFVSHLTTPEGKSHEEGGRVLEKQFRGSRSIAYWSHFMFGIERDKQDPSGVTTFRVLKDRFTGDSNGFRFGLAYDKETGLLHECEAPQPKKYPYNEQSHTCSDDTSFF